MRFIILACLLALSTARRVQIRPRVTEPQVYYEDEDGQAEDEYSPEVYQPRPRALPSPRSKDTLNPSKAPPVQTIRNYNKVNDDGSFTFGYEAADGSFKEETRGTDCVVRGKYGYVDPDGNKREFTYVSGNPCDPNAPKEDDDELPTKEEEDLPGPANYPSVRPRPIQNYPRTTTSRPPTTIFSTEYALQDDEASQELEEEEPKVLIRPTTYRTRPRPNYLQVQPIQGESLYSATPTAATTPATSASPYHHSTQAPRYQSLASPHPLRHNPTPSYQALESSSTPRSITRERPQSVAITPRPHLAQVAAQYVSPTSTERPGVVYATQRSTTASPPAPSPNDIHLNFAAELERYVNTVPVTNRPSQKGQIVKSEPIYQSELVYDPSSGQYNTQLYQSLPQTIGDFRLNHKLQPYVAQSQSLIGLQQLQPVQQASRPAPSRQQQPQEAIYRQQQSEQLLQSQQLYAQQQRRQQQPPAQQKYALLQPQREQQYYYAVQGPPSRGSSQSLSVGQIDQFLRGSTAGF